MRIALDTEFYENGRTIELISVGLVNDEGDEYYAEVVGAGVIAESTPWLAENVRQHLTGTRKPKTLIAHEIVEFADLEPEFWAWYGSYDWVVLCQLFGTMMDLPPTWPMFIRDLRQVTDSTQLPPQLPSDGPEHHALSDAKWLMRAMKQHDEEVADKEKAWQMFEDWHANQKSATVSTG